MKDAEIAIEIDMGSLLCPSSVVWMERSGIQKFNVTHCYCNSGGVIPGFRYRFIRATGAPPVNKLAA